MPASPRRKSCSFNIDLFVRTLSTTKNILIIQDVDGVCMRLVKDPIARTIQLDYLIATQVFNSHFYVLTNGEHVGVQGLNSIVDRALNAGFVAEELLNHIVSRPEYIYLPGLAAGGIQWQDRDGRAFHPGVSNAELAFLERVPKLMKDWLRSFLAQHSTILGDVASLEPYVTSSVLDNRVAPSINLNNFYELLSQNPNVFRDLQKRLQMHLRELINQASTKGLENAFFIHYTPNFGKDNRNRDVICYSRPGNPGTTDFQFMLCGALKEAGVLALLNHYYFQQAGYHPLGADFTVRQAPSSLDSLLQLATAHFDPDVMPTIVGIGDTITSHISEGQIQRGGSDRNFLQLIQNLNSRFEKDNLIVYVDSSGDGLKNRQSLRIQDNGHTQFILEGINNVRDPLMTNVVFAGGYSQYCSTFVAAAKRRKATSSNIP